MHRRPFALVLHLTHRCNMRCAYCYAGAGRGRDMSLDTAVAAIDAARGMARDFPAVEVLFFGGEPLLRFDLVRQISELAKAGFYPQPCRFGLTTNGTLLTNARARWLAENDFDVAVSIDGAPASHDAHRRLADGRGSHARVLRGIRRLQRYGVRCRAALTVTPATAGALVENLDYLRRLGVRDVHVTPDYDRSDWTPAARAALQGQIMEAVDFYLEHFDELSISFLDEKVCAWLDPQGAWPCGFGFAKLAVSAAGHFYGCERMIRGDDEEQWRVGDVRNGLDLAKLARLKREADDEAASCRACSFRRVCQHHCACVNLARSGRLGRADRFICFYERTCLAAAASLAQSLRAAPFPAGAPAGAPEPACAAV